MTHSVSQHLGIEVAKYDQIIQQFIPAYLEMIDRATALVAEINPDLVLDLGAGTGALSERLLERTEHTVVELWDVDQAMLEVARTRLARFGERARFVARSFAEPLPACQAIMASLALHHIRTLEAKGELYRQVAQALRPGGRLVNADATVPTEAPRQARIYRDWADHMVERGIAERDVWRHFDEWSDEDRYLSADQEIELLQRAGLRASVAWRSGPSTVILGLK